MAKQTIGVGAVAGDGTGDTPRTAFTKCNDNFDELYSETLVGLTPTKGRIVVGDDTGWVVLGVGTDGQLLTADSTEDSGVKWADASALANVAIDATSIEVGDFASAGGASNVYLGMGITPGNANSDFNVAVGKGIVVPGHVDYLALVGHGASATGSGSAVAIGPSASTSTYGVAVGRMATAGVRGVAIGFDVDAGDNEVVIGAPEVTSTTLRGLVSAPALLATASAATETPLTIKGAASQSANLLEIDSSSGSGGDLWRLSASGDVTAAGTISARDRIYIRDSSNTNEHYIGAASNNVTWVASGGAIFSSSSGQFTFNVGEINLGSYTSPGDFIIRPPGRANNNGNGRNVTLGAQSAGTSASTGGAGGYVRLIAGNAAVGDFDGGDVILTVGTGSGTGSNGNVIIGNLPTSDPLVANALWNDSGTLKISAG